MELNSKAKQNKNITRGNILCTIYWKCSCCRKLKTTQTHIKKIVNSKMPTTFVPDVFLMANILLFSVIGFFSIPLNANSYFGFGFAQNVNILFWWFLLQTASRYFLKIKCNSNWLTEINANTNRHARIENLLWICPCMDVVSLWQNEWNWHRNMVSNKNPHIPVPLC